MNRTGNTSSAPELVTVYFGNKKKEEGKAQVCIYKFNDLNGDGKRDPNEPPLPGWSFTVSPAPLLPAPGPVTTGP
jgi:hypothetical protein